MASLDVIRNITIRAQTQGVDETTKKLEQLAEAQEDVGAASQKAAKGVQSIDEVIAKQNQQFASNTQLMSQMNDALQKLAVSNENIFRITRLVADQDRRLYGLARNGYVDLVNLATANDNLAQSTSKVAQETTNFANVMVNSDNKTQAATASIVGFGLRLGGLLAIITGVIKVFSDFSAELVAIDKAALAAGLSLERFQELRGAAAMVGVGGTEFAKGVEGVARELNEARRAETDLSRLLDANNVKWRDGTKLLIDTNQALKIAADLIRGIASEQDKIKIAEAFGAKDLLPVLRGGSGEMERLADKARELGSNIDAELVQKATEFDREWTRIVAEWTIRFKAGVATILTEMGKLSEMKFFGIQILPTTQELEKFQSEMDQTGTSWKSLLDTLGLTGVWDKLIGEVGRLNQGLSLIASNAQRVSETFDELDKKRFEFGGEPEFPGIRPGPGFPGHAPGVMPQPRPSTTVIPVQTEGLNRETEFLRRSNEQRETRMRLLQAEQAALGQTAEEALRLRLIEEELGKARERNIQLTPDQVRAIEEWAAAYAKLRTQIDLTKEMLKSIEQIGTSFATSFLQGIAQGQSMVESLTGALRGLSNQLISMGTRLAFQGLERSLAGIGGTIGGLAGGNPVAGAFSFGGGAAGAAGLAGMAGPIGLAIAGVGLGIGLLTSSMERSSQRAEEQRRQQIELARQQRERLEALRDRIALSQLDTSTLEGALAAFEISAQRERATVGGLKGRGTEEAKLLEEALANERAAIIKRFADEAIEQEKRRVDQVKKLQQDLEDRLFAISNDTNTLAGQLAAFERQAARERIEIARQAAELLPLLEETLAAERLDIIKDFNQKAIDEQRRLAEEFQTFLANLRRTIQQFIDNLRGGAGSFLSPTARLSAAQTAFSQQLALAQTGDQGALGTITQYAQNLIDASRAVFGSTTAFQTLVTTVIGQLEALPDIVAANDPVVAAVEAAQASNDALLQSLVTLADINNDGIVDQNELLNFIQGNTGNTATSTAASSALLNTINALTASMEDQQTLMHLNTRTIAAQSGILDAIASNTRYAPTRIHAFSTTNSAIDFSANPSGTTGTPKTVFEHGGLVPGSGPVNATLHGGEFVSTAATVRQLGVGFFEGLARGNANEQIIVEVRALRQEVAMFRRENGMNIAANTNVTADSASGLAVAILDANARRERNARQEARRPA